MRICGTSINSRKCTIDFREESTVLVWWQDKRYDEVPFAVFGGFNHGSIVHPSASTRRKARFLAANGPGTLALEALKVNGKDAYARAARRFAQASEANYASMPASKRDRYQQLFFRVYDDVDKEIDDFYADFFVVDRQGEMHGTLTRQWDRQFESTFYRHSALASCRVMMINLSELVPFVDSLRQEDAKLVFEITAKSPLPNVTYQAGRYTVFDGTANEPTRFIRENTTTFVRVVLNRKEASKLMNVKGSGDVL